MSVPQAIAGLREYSECPFAAIDYNIAKLEYYACFPMSVQQLEKFGTANAFEIADLAQHS